MYGERLVFASICGVTCDGLKPISALVEPCA
jgi:hypothetical protein